MLWATSLTPVTILNNLFCLYMIVFNVFGPHCACSFSLTNDKLSHPHIFQRHYIQIPLGLLHSTVDRFIGSPWTLHHLFVIQKLNYCAFILHNFFFLVTIITPIFFQNNIDLYMYFILDLMLIPSPTFITPIHKEKGYVHC